MKPLSKFVVFFLNPLILILTAILSLPVLSDEIKTQYPKQTLYLAIIVIFGSVVNYYFSILIPFFDKSKKRLNYINTWAPVQREVEAYQRSFHPYVLDVKVLSVENKIFHLIEPKDGNPAKRKLKFFGSIFIPEWEHGSRMHKKLVLSTGQGIAGKAYDAGPLTGVNCHILNDPTINLPDFNFNTEQIALLTGLIIVGCCAIPHIDNPRDCRGILSVESRTPGAESLINNQISLDEFKKRTEELAIIISSLIK